MLKILSALFVFSLLMTSSCSKKTDTKPQNTSQSTQSISNLPEWVLAPEVKDGIAAVGIAGPSAGGIRFQIPRAEMDAKANIAATLQTEISRVTKEALRQAKVNDVDDVESVFSQATKEVVAKMPLSGVKRINIHQAQDGTLYVHMVLKQEDFSQYFQNNQKAYEERLKKANLTRDNLNKAQEAVKGLFDELEKERGTEN